MPRGFCQACEVRFAGGMTDCRARRPGVTGRTPTGSCRAARSRGLPSPRSPPQTALLARRIPPWCVRPLLGPRNPDRPRRVLGVGEGRPEVNHLSNALFGMAWRIPSGGPRGRLRSCGSAGRHIGRLFILREGGLPVLTTNTRAIHCHGRASRRRCGLCTDSRRDRRHSPCRASDCCPISLPACRRPR